MDKVVIEKTKIKIETYAKGFYKNMKLAIAIYKNSEDKERDGITIYIKDMDDDADRQAFIEWLGNDKFKYHVGARFVGGMVDDVPSNNENIEALVKDKEFAKWFKNNVLTIADKLGKVKAL